MRRAATILMLFALAPLLMGGGGLLSEFQAIPSNFRPIDEVRAFIVVDPHEYGTTTTAKEGLISIQTRHGGSAQALFNVVADWPFLLGCDPSKTTVRFVQDTIDGTSTTASVRVSTWMDPTLMKALFRQAGITVDDVNTIPGVTQVLNGTLQPDGRFGGECVNDFANPGITVNGSEADLDIQTAANPGGTCVIGQTVIVKPNPAGADTCAGKVGRLVLDAVISIFAASKK